MKMYYNGRTVDATPEVKRMSLGYEPADGIVRITLTTSVGNAATFELSNEEWERLQRDVNALRAF